MTTRPNPDRPTVVLFTWAAGSVDAIAYVAANVPSRREKTFRIAEKRGTEGVLVISFSFYAGTREHAAILATFLLTQHRGESKGQEAGSEPFEKSRIT